MKNFDIMGVTKNNYIWGIAWKGRLGQFREGSAKNREEAVFDYDLILVLAR